MTTTLSDNAAIAAANAVVARLDLGSGPGKVQILTAGDVLLAEGELSDPAADGSAVIVGTDAVVTFDTITGATAVAGGTAAKALLVDSDDNVEIEGDVGEVGSGALVELVTMIVVAGQPVTFSSATYKHPKSDAES